MEGSSRRSDMGFIPFVKILLRNQRSNKAATFGSMFGVLISIAFLTGSFMTSDAIVSDLFEDQLKDIDYHFKAYNSYWEDTVGFYSELTSREGRMMNDIRSHEGIEDAGLFKNIWGLNYQGREMGVFGLDEGASRFVFEEDSILPDDGNSCVINRIMAEEEGLSQGDSINISFIEWKDIPVTEKDQTRSEPIIIMKDWDEPLLDPGFYQTVEIYHNFTMNISGILEDKGWDTVSTHIYSPGYRLYFSTEGLANLNARINEDTDFPKSIEGLILFRVDPDFFSNIDNAILTRREAKTLRNDMESIVQPNDYSMEDDRVEEIYENYLFWSITMRVFLVILSLPLFLLCFYLVLVGSRIGMENKVQEISLLKVKGATKGQVFWMLMLESILHGTIGTLAGILIGSSLSSLFILMFLGETVGILNLLPGFTMVITLLLISIIIVTLIRLRSMNRLSKMDILKAVRGSPERKEKQYKPGKDIFVVSVMGIFISVMFYFNEFSPQGLFQLALYSIMTLMKPLLILFLPFLLIMSISRLLVQGVPRTIDLVARPLRSFNRELHSLLITGLKYRKKTVSVMIILISITVSFGILVLSQMETRENAIETSLGSSVPTDLYVAVQGDNPDRSNNISAIEGVDDLVHARSTWCNFGRMGNYDYYGGYGTLIAFDVTDYRKVVSPSSDLSREGKWIKDLQKDQDDGYVPVIINSVCAKENDLIVGDEINITIDYFRYEYDMFREGLDFQSIQHIESRVIGIVNHLPGLRSITASELVEEEQWGDGDRWFLSDLHEESAFYIDIDNLPRNTSMNYHSYLIDVDGREGSVKENITSMMWKDGVLALVDRDHELEKIKDIPANRGMDLMLVIQFSCVLIAVVVGLFLMQIVQNTSRRREFAEVLARGATKDNIFRLLLSEGIVILIIGLVIGTFTGFLVGYGFQTVFTGDWASTIGDLGSDLDVENRIEVDNGVVFPWTISLIHSVTISSMVLAIYLVSRFSSKIDIASNLRMRRS
jgi:ABC-type lipoprotein release transport system permease subunit